MGDNYDYLAKTLLIGESGVGKSCILQSFTDHEFAMNHLPTIAIDFKTRIVDINGTRLNMQIWDTAGQERFNTLTATFFKCTLTSIACYRCGVFCHRQAVIHFSEQMDGTDTAIGATQRTNSACGQQT